MIDRDRDDTLKFNRLCFTEHTPDHDIFCHFIHGVYNIVSRNTIDIISTCSTCNSAAAITVTLTANIILTVEYNKSKTI